MATKKLTDTNYLLSSLYSTVDNDDNDDVVNPVHVNIFADVDNSAASYGEMNNVTKCTQTDFYELMDDVISLKEQLLKLKSDFREAVESTVNREMGFREHMSVRLASLEELIMTNIQKMDSEIYNSFLCRDKQWEKQLDELRQTTPFSQRTTVKNDLSPIAPPSPSSQSGTSPCTLVSSDPLFSFKTDSSEGLKPHRRQRPTVTTLSKGNMKRQDDIPGKSRPSRRVAIKGQSDMPTTLVEVAKAQRDDPSVCELSKSGGPPSAVPSHIQFVVQQGLLYRRVPGTHQESKYQLVIPGSLVPQFLQHFHSNQSGGHLGRLKTLLRVLEVAWWPGVRKDVMEHTESCRACQQHRRHKKKNIKVALERFIHGPSPPFHHAAYSNDGRQQKMAERVKQRVGVCQTGVAKCCFSHCKDGHFQKGSLVQVRSQPLSETRIRSSAMLAPKWEGPAPDIEKCRPLYYGLRWNSPPD